MSTICGIGTALGLGLAGYFSFTYFSQPYVANISLIRNQANVVDRYSGSAPIDELNNLIDRIEVVKEDNPSYAAVFTKLEDEVVKAKIEIGDINDPKLYSPYMDEVKSQADWYVENNSRSGWPLFGAGIWLGFAGFSAYSLVKDRKNVRERAEQEAYNSGTRQREAFEAAMRVVGRTRAADRAREQAQRAGTSTEASSQGDNDIWRNRDDDNDGNQIRH
jgi:hypothetical protein